MRVLFAGGKDIGCGCLEYLLGHPQVEVVGVFVNPDGDIACDRWYHSATELALAYSIPVFAPCNINSARVVNQVRNVEPDLIVVAYYDQILRPEIIGLPRLGCINLHMALAEEYQGCYPTTWAIINGENRVGVLLHIALKHRVFIYILSKRVEIEEIGADAPVQ